VIATFYPVVHSNADNFWRVRAPAKAIGAKVAAIPMEQAEQILTQPNRSDSLPWSIEVEHPDGRHSSIKTALGWKRFNSVRRKYRSLTAEFPLHEGTAVFFRPTMPMAVLAKSMRNHHEIRTVGETDDNYFAREFNSELKRKMSDDDLEWYSMGMASMGVCVFSTAWLRDRHFREFRGRFGKSKMPELHVCRNAIDVADWPERNERTGPIRVGFMGSDSHIWDIPMIHPALAFARENGAETHMIGFHPGTIDDEGLDEQQLAARDAWRDAVTKYTPWKSTMSFREQGLPLDIMLCPLLSNDFTFGRSDAKAIEGTISGCALVLTNNPVYSGAWKHEQNCLMANSRREFVEATRRLMRDGKLRYELVTAAQAYVSEERGVECLRKEWGEALC